MSKSHSNEQKQQTAKPSVETHVPQEEEQFEQGRIQVPTLGLGQSNTTPLKQSTMLRLQRTMGNAAAQRAIQRRKATTNTIAPPPVHSAPAGLIQREGNDYQTHIEGSTTAAADNAGNVAAGEASDHTLPSLDVDLDHAASRQAYFRNQMVSHLNTGMHGYYSDLRETHAYKTMEKQLNGYMKDIPAMTKANNAYNTFVPSANVAVKGMQRHFALQDQLGFEDDTNFENQMTPQQREALQKTIRDNPELLSRTQSVNQKQSELEQARTTLRGHMQGFAAIITGKAIKEVQKTITTNEGEQKKINDKIAKVAKIAGYVQKAATVAAAGAGALAPAAINTAMQDPAKVAAEAARDKTMDKIKSGAGHVNTATGHLATAVTVGMQLYYAKELKDFESKINQAKGELNELKALQAAQELESKLTKLEGAKQAFKNAVEAYDAAIEDRRVAMAAIGAKTDKALVGEKKMKGGSDFVSQVMLYMTSVRENRSLVKNGMDAGSTAKSEIQSARTQLSSHRGSGYQTNRTAYGTSYQYEKTGKDSKVLTKMWSLTLGWLDKAKIEKDLLDKQEASAAKVMGAAGRSGQY